MSLPDVRRSYDSESLSQFESVQLFIDRSLGVNPKFEITNENIPAVAQLCNDLDGIPLAIELAAARMNVLSVEKILERLSDRFKLLTGGKRTSLPRQQTLKALIDWSYGLCRKMRNFCSEGFPCFREDGNSKRQKQFAP